MIFTCPICGIGTEMSSIEYNEKLIQILYQWKGELTIDQVIKKLKHINKELKEG